MARYFSWLLLLWCLGYGTIWAQLATLQKTKKAALAPAPRPAAAPRTLASRPDTLPGANGRAGFGRNDFEARPRFRSGTPP